MGSTIHVIDYLAEPPDGAPINVVFGNEPFLKQLALIKLRQSVLADPDIPYGQYEGNSTDWRDVLDELSTVSLFSTGGPRLVVVRHGDPFVTEFRAKLKGYFERPDKHSVLILEVSKWAANTHLYKLADKSGLQIECRVPETGTGKNKVPDCGRIAQWLVTWAKDQHHVKLTQQVAVQLVDLIGVEFGLLDQEVARLALYTEKDNRITKSLVQQHGGGWRAKTVWKVLDAALAGDTADALGQLDRLFQAGQDPNALMGPIAWSLRRFAAATRVYQRSERQGRRMRLPDALEQGGFYRRPPEGMHNAEKTLRRLGRDRAGRLYGQLRETDLALKGSHSSPTLARLAIEHLLIQIAKKA